MPIEIERKFLAPGDGWRAAAHAVVPMAQATSTTIGDDSGCACGSVRVRIVAMRRT